MAAAYGRHLSLRTAVVYGGVPVDPQARELQHAVEIFVATPASCSTSSASARRTWAGSRCSSSTRPTGCSK